ncbi:branched-chain-amino-acid aminotransferase-like protein 2 [Arachis stenosperma]|uniref:branched-chain-amino-acid aminotransferase-like protein 2 n=1 Tax=Arachis stenosperma TaxID=217475 RepID=UPI0025ACB87F|nr:branched-chain-amino-acid aminotransferase-like protein 2 [Arachis stenosperma]
MATAAVEEQELDPSLPACVNLISAILAMEPSDLVISHARACGGGSITESVQKFIWDHCLSTPGDFYAPYLKIFLKKLISEVEFDHGYVLDYLYELYAQYMTSFKDDSFGKRDTRVCKRISYIFPDGCSELQSKQHSRALVFTLQCSLNMLEGDTGCSIWPSSLFLSELILSHPKLFSNKSCFEIGSGVGLVGLCLAHVKASKVILSDGDLSTLANMKFNLELNHLNIETDMPQGSEDPSMVKCMHLPWESTSESQLQDIVPDVVLGADVIYDPVCLPHLVRVLAILLNRTKSDSCKPENGDACDESEAPVAYIAYVIRNIETFDYFLSLAKQANLDIMDLSDSLKPLNLLRYMQPYNQTHVKLLSIRSEMVGSEIVEVIHSWSAPRSLSTSTMYSFAQRDDIEVLDEPLYANFLRVTGLDRPYRKELLSKMESDGNKVVNDIIFGPGRKKYRYCKHIAKQRVPGLTNDLMKKGKHFILIRNPLDILPSFDKVVPPSFFELGLAELLCIYNELRELGKSPPVIDAADLQQHPEATLRGLCDDLEIPFQPTMLSWEAGPKSIDGLWAPWWYESIHKSTGFNQAKRYPQTFPFSLYDLLEQSLPLYNMLRRHVKKKQSSLLSPPLPLPDLPVPTNEKILVWVGDEIVPRDSAKVSVFDSVVQGGDSVWEGLRVYNGKIFKLEEHLDRMFDSAKALAFENVPTRDEIKDAIFRTLIRNGMFDNSHIRLSLTRGKKVTSGMSPAFNLYGCTLIVLAEWKPPVYDNTRGIVLVTATTRRNSPNSLDSKIHHNNLLNNILAKIEGNNAKVDDAIMLDKDGYVSETNATNIFIVKKGRVSTPHADYCLPGITRATIMDLVVKEDLILEERRISLSEVHTADEMWTSGTMGELSPVVKVDGRRIGDGEIGPVTKRLQDAYKNLTQQSGVPIPTYLAN